MQRKFGFVETSKGNTDKARHIRPADIELSKEGLCGNFGNSDIERSAGRLVSLMRLMIHWKPFSVEFLAIHYRTNAWDTERMFYGLSGPWPKPHAIRGWGQAGYVQLLQNAQCSVTDVFILRCAGFEAGFPAPEYS